MLGPASGGGFVPVMSHDAEDARRSTMRGAARVAQSPGAAIGFLDAPNGLGPADRETVAAGRTTGRGADFGSPWVLPDTARPQVGAAVAAEALARDAPFRSSARGAAPIGPASLGLARSHPGPAGPPLATEVQDGRQRDATLRESLPIAPHGGLLPPPPQPAAGAHGQFAAAGFQPVPTARGGDGAPGPGARAAAPLIPAAVPGPSRDASHTVRNAAEQLLRGSGRLPSGLVPSSELPGDTKHRLREQESRTHTAGPSVSGAPRSMPTNVSLRDDSRGEAPRSAPDPSLLSWVGDNPYVNTGVWSGAGAAR